MVIYADFVNKQITVVDASDPFTRIREKVEAHLRGYKVQLIEDAYIRAKTWFTRHCCSVDKAAEVGVRQAMQCRSPFDNDAA